MVSDSMIIEIYKLIQTAIDYFCEVYKCDRTDRLNTYMDRLISENKKYPLNVYLADVSYEIDQMAIQFDDDKKILLVKEISHTIYSLSQSIENILYAYDADDMDIVFAKFAKSIEDYVIKQKTD